MYIVLYIVYGDHSFNNVSFCRKVLKTLTRDTCIAKGKLIIVISSLQCFSVLSDILVKNELCIPLERGSNVLSTG